MNSFTPRPWEAQKVDSQQWEINAPHGDPYLGHSSWKCFASVYDSDDDKAKGRKRAEENARLIAKAPDMLAMLQECHATLASVFVSGVPDGLVDRVWSLIQEAEGK